MTNDKKLLGVLGGLGPMSTVCFCELLTAHTKAKSDSDHIDMIISSRATTPDRTAFILGKSELDPLPVMREETERLCRGRPCEPLRCGYCGEVRLHPCWHSGGCLFC